MLQYTMVELLYTAGMVAVSAGVDVEVIRQANVGSGVKPLPCMVSTTEADSDTAGPYEGEKEVNVAAAVYVTNAVDSG